MITEGGGEGAPGGPGGTREETSSPPESDCGRIRGENRKALSQSVDLSVKGGFDKRFFPKMSKTEFSRLLVNDICAEFE